jgi:chemotaxis methyl-accepting protein methylase
MRSTSQSLPCASISVERVDARIVGAVLEIVRDRTGVDFSGYRPAMLARRIVNHFSSAAVASLDEYLHLLQSSASEPFRVLERITIKVSRFYRHAPTFDHLRDVVLPELARMRAQPLRILSAGCGVGEEAYTFAMLLERAGIEGTIEATDVDCTALQGARIGTYPIEATAELPSALRDEFLEPVVVNGQPRYRVRDDLRARVRFTRHDITAMGSPPGGENFDLVSCRNVLIYLQRSAQTNATKRLLDMIREDGVLCLGEAEWPPPEFAERLDPMPHRTRLFRLRSPHRFAADNDLNRARFRAGT